MEEYFEGISEELTKWDMIKDIADQDQSKKRPEVDNGESSVQLLPRQDVTLYGTIPKMEQRVYSKCKECRLVFNPRDVLLHKNCVGKGNSTPQNLKKKVKSKSKKSSHSSNTFKKPLPPPPLTTAPPTPVVAEPKTISVSSTTSIDTITTTSLTDTVVSSTETSRTTVASNAEAPAASTSETTTVASPTNSSNSRYSKSRKGNKVPKEYDPDVHCGVVEGNKGPCTRSITCTNHRIQLKKLVPGRSKDIHQLIAERKAAKEKDLKLSSNSSYMPQTSTEEKEIFCQNTSYVPIVATIVSTIDSPPPPTTTYVPIMPKTTNENVTTTTTTSSTTTTTTHSRQTTTSVTTTSVTTKITPTEPVVIDTSKSLENNGYNPQNSAQESAIGTVPVVYMPMSPISVVSPVQFVQIGKNMICLESPQSAMSPPLPNQSVFLTIPDQQQSNVKMYKSHPKPIAIPTFGARKVGGAILLSNQRLERQRNDILMAINTKRKTSNSSQGYKAVSLLNNTPHRPNILKVKSLTKVNCKRSANDKINSSDSKQLRLAPDVNGFILHADMSESADAPQPNNCIQEKIALLNMK